MIYRLDFLNIVAGIGVTFPLDSMGKLFNSNTDRPRNGKERRRIVLAPTTAQLIQVQEPSVSGLKLEIWLNKTGAQPGQQVSVVQQWTKNDTCVNLATLAYYIYLFGRSIFRMVL